MSDCAEYARSHVSKLVADNLMSIYRDHSYNVIYHRKISIFFLSFNLRNNHAITPMIYFFDVPRIFLEQKLISHGYFQNMNALFTGKRHVL